MKNAFTKIGLVGKQNSAGCVESLHSVIEFLLDRKIEIVLDAITAQILDNDTIPHYPLAELGNYCELAIVIGGDGMMLHAARALVPQNIPVIGVNRGTVGFLTDIHPTELNNKLCHVLDGHFEEEKRFLLSTEIITPDGPIPAGLSLNDVALIPGSGIHMTEFEIEIDEHFVCRQRADGVIITTPTGSTAYALSGGGPILYPDLDIIAIVPMFPHTLSSRPIVVSASSEINIKVVAENPHPAKVTSDGNTPIIIEPGNHIQIKRYNNSLRLIHPLDYQYFETLRAKLGWGTRP